MKRSCTKCSKVCGMRVAGAALLILAATSLVGCGGGGNGSSAAAKSASNCEPEDFTVVAGANPRELVFDWDTCNEDAVDHYRVEVNADGASGYTVLAGAESLAASEYTHAVPVHLTDWVNALYRVVAVDASGNEQSSQDLGLLDMVAAEDVIGYFKASNAAAQDEFGYRVSLDGDTLAVGAQLEDSAATGIDDDATSAGDDDGAVNAGAVYVFTRDGDNRWSQQAYIKASNAAAGDAFGSSVSVDGDTLVVGAVGEDSSATGGEADDSAFTAGAVYVFTRDGSGVWSQQAYLKASNAEGIDLFATSVSLSGDTLAVGATGEDSATDADEGDNSAAAAGAVYVFTRDGGDAWSQQAYLKASNADANDLFGSSVSLSGDTLAVGARNESSSAMGIDGDEADNSAVSAGAVYVFTRDGDDAWSQQAYLKASNAEANDQFGYSVSLDGDTLAVGAIREDSAATGINHDAISSGGDNGAQNSGAVYVFTLDGDDAWSQQAYIKAANAAGSDEFGSSVSLDRDTLAVGALKEDSAATGIDGDGGDDSATDSGAVYVFTRDADNAWSQRAYVKASNTEVGDQFGGRVSLSGDTLAVGAINENSSATGIDGDTADGAASRAGAVYLY